MHGVLDNSIMLVSTCPCPMPPLVWFWTCGCATTYHRLCGNFTGYRSTAGSNTSCACWSTRRRSGTRRSTVHCRHVDTCLSAQPPTATPSCRVHIVSLVRGLSQSLHPELGTGCRVPTELKTSTCSTDSFKRSLESFLFQYETRETRVD